MLPQIAEGGTVFLSLRSSFTTRSARDTGAQNNDGTCHYITGLLYGKITDCEILMAYL